MQFELKWSATAEMQFQRYWSKAPDSHDLASDLIGKVITRADISADRERFEAKFESREIDESARSMKFLTELLFELTIGFDPEKVEFIVLNFDPLV